jgi:alkylation response protein AidB-like acyl-CoA dehydrogenase
VGKQPTVRCHVNMDDEWSPDERAIRDAITDLVKSTIAPRSSEYDRAGRFPRENLELLGAQGYLGMTVPPEYGGAGASYLAQTLVVEALAYGCPATAVIYEVHNSLHVEAVLRYGSDAQRRAWLPRLLSGEWIGAFALTEPHAGSNAAALATTGEPVAGGYRLRGEKVFITSAGEADRYIVWGRLPHTTGRAGITAWVVDRDSPGLSFGPPEAKMGLHASRTSSMRLDGVFVPTEQRLGSEGAGYGMAMALLDGGRIGIAAQACGIMAAALERSLDYARTREQFGHPIADFEVVQAKLADMALHLRAARLLTYDAARHRDAPDIRLRAAMAKLFSSEQAVRHTLDAIQIHGGYGYMQEFGVERLMRDAKVTEIYEGTSEILRLVVASQILKRGSDWPWEG